MWVLALVVSPLAGVTHAAASPMTGPAVVPIPDTEHTVTSTLKPGEALHAGESIRSANSRYQLSLHHNGNLVLYDTYPVSGRATWPRPGSYEVFSKSRWGSSPKFFVTMQHMVRFVEGTAGLLDVGFHSIPRTYGNYPIQTVDELGQPRSAGCVRQDDAKAVQLYRWAPIGTPVVVVV